MRSLNLKNKYGLYSKNFKLKFSVILVILYVVLFFGYLQEFSPKIVSADIKNGQPILLSIPKTGAIIKIEEVIRNKEFINPPKDTLNAGWYIGSSKPGEIGNAVINAYVHWKYGYTARFADLRFLKQGDIIETIDDNSIINIFVVREVKLYNLEDNIDKVFNSNDGDSHLNLVTHDGNWDKDSETYSKRVVVFTDKEDSVTLSYRTSLEKETKAMSDRIAYDLETLNNTALLAPPGFVNQIANQ